MRFSTPILLALLVAPCGAAAQGVRGVGLFAGSSESRQIRSDGEDSATRDGFVGGAWIDVAFPASRWSVLAEGGYAVRGGKYPVGSGFTGQVESDVLEATVAPTVHLDVAFVGAFLYGGPTLEVPLRTRATVDLEPAFRNPAGQALSVTAGGGIDLRVPDTWSFRLEIRRVLGLSASYTGDAGDFKHRATEILVRVGKIRP